jgi:peroxiredoxin
MNHNTITYAIIFIVSIAANFEPKCVAELRNPDAQSNEDAVSAAFNELGAEYDRLWKVEFKTHADGKNSDDKSDEHLSDEEWLKRARAAVGKTLDPDSAMLPRLLAFAKSRADSPLAIDALFIVVRRGGNQTGEVYGLPWQTKEEALDHDWSRQMKDPRFAYVLEQLSGSIPSRKTETFLRSAMQHATNPNAVAAATFYLASYYQNLAHVHDICRKAKAKSHPTDFDRYWKLVLAPYIEKNFPIDREQNSAEVERLLNLVVDKYSDVPADKWQQTGPYRILLGPQPYPHPKTFGDLAHALLFQLKNIIPGKPAPDIVGTDANGNRFRLSDYRGKVVLLTFSANWCGNCVELYPMERELVRKFRDKPFAMLSVSEDETIDTLRASISDGEITWRCWWDGEDGVIRNAWNCRGVPQVFILDHNQILQDANITRLSSQQEFEDVIASLVKAVPRSPLPSKP